MWTNGWDKWGDFYEEQWAPIMHWMCDAVQAAPGMRVLDLACGTGQPALPLARRVTGSGHVLATDIDDAMLSATARRAREAGLDQVAVRKMNMQALDAADGEFDAVTLGFALMFSPDPAQVMREVRRVLRPAGRCAVVVWDAPEKNPFFTTVFGPTAAVTQQPPPPPDAPGPFRLARAAELAELLRAAGLVDVEVAPRPFTMQSASVDAHWEMLSDMALRSTLQKLPPEDAERLHRSVVEALAPYVDAEGRVRFVMTPLGASACAPGRS